MARERSDRLPVATLGFLAFEISACEVGIIDQLIEAHGSDFFEIPFQRFVEQELLNQFDVPALGSPDVDSAPPLNMPSTV